MKVNNENDEDDEVIVIEVHSYVIDTQPFNGVYKLRNKSAEGQKERVKI
jgi:hypothetical protein